MKARGLVILALVVAVLGAFVYWVERELPTTDERQERENRILLWEATGVDGLDIQRGEERTELRRTVAVTEGEASLLGTGEWSLRVPLEARADGAAVDSLLAKLVNLERKRAIEGADRGELGLEPPELTITLSQGEEREIMEVGALVPGSTDRILAYGERILLVEGSFLEDLLRAPGDWRSKSLFPGSQTEVNRIETNAGEGSVTLAKRDSTWWIESPLEDLAAGDRVSQFLLALAGLQATDFVDERVEGEPTLGLKVSLEGREEAFTLDWNLGGAEESPFLVRVGDQVARVEDTLGEYLGTSPEPWRSRAWIHTNSYEVSHFRVEEPGETLSFERVEGAWMKGEEERGFAEISDFFFALSEPRAEELAPVEEVDALKRIFRVHLVTADDHTETAELYEAEDGVLLATSSGRDVALRMPPEVKEKVTAAVEALRNPVEEEAEEPL